MEKIKLTSRDEVLYYDGKTFIEKVPVKSIIKESNEVLLSNGIKIKIESNKTGDFRRTDWKRTEFRQDGYLGFIRKFEEGSTDKYHTFYNAVNAKIELKRKLLELVELSNTSLSKLILDEEAQLQIIKLNKKLK
nr:MAG TPA: hypothetical protein [Caudoviricetes sp.]